MKTNNLVDTAKLSLLLNELRLPAMKRGWARFAEQADKEGWPAARFLAAIAEHELAERDQRRIERHLAAARLLPGKTLDTFEFEAVPMISKAQVKAITAGDTWLENGANLLLFGPPGSGKSHLASAIGLALIENGWRVLYTRTTDLVQKLQLARRRLMAARSPFCPVVHRAHLAAMPLGVLGGIDHPIQADDICPRVEEDAIAGKAISSCPADLLVIALDGLWHVTVDDVPDVGLVDSHAERNGGAHDFDAIAAERVLHEGALFCFHAGVVGEGSDSETGEVLGG